jgi:hypothetical protein
MNRRPLVEFAAVIRTVISLALAASLVAACGKEEKPLTPEQKEAIARAAGQPRAVQSPTELLDRLTKGVSEPGVSRAADIVRLATIKPFASPYVQRSAVDRPNRLTEFKDLGPAATPEPVHRPVRRQRFEDVPSLAALPEENVPGVQIGWYINKSIDAYLEAIDRNKPLVLVAVIEECEHCDRLLSAMRCSEVGRLAGEAVFAALIPARDLAGSAMTGSLNISTYPTITVVEPEARMLLERGRINGYFNAEDAGRHLTTILWTPPRRFTEFDPAATSPAPPTLSGPQPRSVEEAAAEAKKLGLVPRAPLPVCK